VAFAETRWICFNGKFVKWKEAKVHVLTHALHYGSAVFEGVRCYKTVKGSAVFRLDEHIERLYNSAKMLKMKPPVSPKRFAEMVKETVHRNKMEACYIRPLIYRGYGQMGLNPLNCPVEYFIAVWFWDAYLGKKGLEGGVKTMISSYTKYPDNCLPTKAKVAGCYVNSSLAKMEALEKGFDEAILLDLNGYVCEGPGENIFIVEGGVIKTPPLHAAILQGIRRRSVLEVAKDMGFKVEETMLTRSQLYLADEVFFTGTATEIAAVTEIDGRSIGEGKVGKLTRKLQKKLFDIVQAKDKKYEAWLDLV
jgi:branched-chain amino acid aminotransferase